MIYLPDFLKTNHLIEKASKVRFLKPEKLQKHSNERKRKEKKKERGEEKEEKKKKSNSCTLPARYILWILPTKYQLSKIIRHV